MCPKLTIHQAGIQRMALEVKWKQLDVKVYEMHERSSIGSKPTTLGTSVPAGAAAAASAVGEVKRKPMGVCGTRNKVNCRSRAR